MVSPRSYRSPQDLLDIVADLSRRIETLERTRRLPTSAVDSGELRITNGRITIRNANDKRVMQISPGTFSPFIRFYPASSGSDSHGLTMYGFESGDYGAALQLSVDSLPSGEISGGKLLLMTDRAYLSRQGTGDPEGYFSIGEAFPNSFRWRGLFWNGGQYDKEDGIVVGTFDVAAGFGGFTWNYVEPYDDPPIVLYSLTNVTGVVNHVLTSSTVNGFVITWSGTTAKTVHFMVLRRSA